MDIRVQATIRELYDQMKEFASVNWSPLLEVSHRVADTALKSLEERMANLPATQQDIVRYMFYQELLLKAAEFQTLVDVMTGQVPLDNDELWDRVEQHVDTILRG